MGKRAGKVKVRQFMRWDKNSLTIGKKKKTIIQNFNEKEKRKKNLLVCLHSSSLPFSQTQKDVSLCIDKVQECL